MSQESKTYRRGIFSTQRCEPSSSIVDFGLGYRPVEQGKDDIGVCGIYIGQINVTLNA